MPAAAFAVAGHACEPPAGFKSQHRFLSDSDGTRPGQADTSLRCPSSWCRRRATAGLIRGLDMPNPRASTTGPLIQVPVTEQLLRRRKEASDRLRSTLRRFSQTVDNPRRARRIPEQSLERTQIDVDQARRLTQVLAEWLAQRDESDGSAALQGAAFFLQHYFGAEACSIFLVDWPPLGYGETEQGPTGEITHYYVQLVARYTLKLGFRFDPTRIEIEKEGTEGITAWLISRERAENLDSANILATPFGDKAAPDHLLPGQYRSILFIPLFDRRDRLFGAIKLDNKLSDDNDPGQSGFSAEEAYIACEEIAPMVAGVLKEWYITTTLEQLTSELYNGKYLTDENVFAIVLETAVKLLRADRGDLAMRKGAQGQLVFACRRGPGTITVNSEVPLRGVVRSVWETGKPRIEPDTRRASDYYACDPRTRSEIAALLGWDTERFGVLNLEAFQEHAFDKQGLTWIQLLCQHAALAIRGWMQGQAPATVRDETARTADVIAVLRSVQQISGLDAGILYVAEPTVGELRGTVFIGGRDSGDSTFSYALHERSLATAVFHRRTPQFVPDPHNHPDVNMRGVERLGINSPMLGLPLTFRSKAVGALVVWSRSGPPPVKADVSRLEPLAQLAAARIVAESRVVADDPALAQDIIEVIRGVVTADRGRSASLPHLVRLMLHAIQAAGFDRVRYFEYVEDSESQAGSFRGEQALGLPPIPGFVGMLIPLAASAYARRIAGDADGGARVRLNDPQDLGPDPHARTLRKPAWLPWASVPVVVRGRLLGQFAADNAHSRRAITPNGLLCLAAMAALLECSVERVVALETRDTLDISVTAALDCLVELSRRARSEPLAPALQECVERMGQELTEIQDALIRAGGPLLRSEAESIVNLHRAWGFSGLSTAEPAENRGQQVWRATLARPRGGGLLGELQIDSEGHQATWNQHSK